MHLARWGYSAMAMLAFATSLHAQARSPVQDLLSLARAALNDLRYHDADSITKAVLSLDPLRRSERIQALQLRAGALFPEEEGPQQRDSALLALQQLVRIAPSAVLPRDVAWPGLESLLREARQMTFGASASPRDRIALTGPDETAEIDVVASRSAAFQLWLHPAGGGPALFLDSARTTTAKLRFRVLDRGVPKIQSGEYRLGIVAVDESAPDTIRIEFDAVVTAPLLEYLPVPAQLDSGLILPEYTRPKRVAGIVGGVVALVSTIVASRVFRADELSQAADPDGRAVTVGIVMGIGVGAGVWLLDKGEKIPQNVAANQQTRADFERKVSEMRAENARRLTSYQAEITIDPEPRP